MIRILISFGLVTSIGLGAAGCGDNSEDCGPGTVEIDGECVVAGFDCGPGTTEVDGVCVDDGPECGDGTIEQDGECVVPPPGPGVPVISTSTLDFGLTDCGGAATPRAFVIANTGGETFTFDAALGGGASSPYVLAPESGIVGPASQTTVLVFPRPIPETSAVTPNLYADTVTITTDVTGDTPHSIALQQTARGVIVAMSGDLSFPDLRQIGSPALASDVTVQNLGNAPTSVSIGSTNASFSAPVAATPIAGGASAPVTISYVPFESGAFEGELSIEAAGTLCQPLPAPLAASGNGTFAGTAADVVLVGPLRQRNQGASTVCIRLTTGHVACVGPNVANARGAGIGVVPSFLTPNVVRTADGAPLDDVVEVIGMHAHVCARRGDGSVYCWGNVLNARSRENPEGQPFASMTFEGAIGLAAGYGMMCAAETGGTLACVGQPAQRANDVAMGSWTVTGATAVSLNGGGGYALQSDGTVLSFGVATNGARGNGDASNSPPSPVTGLTDIVQISGSVKRPSNRHGGGCAVHATGGVSCWGDGRHGMNGDGTENNPSAPVQVQTATATPLTGVSEMDSGRNHRCAIATDGVYCWGRGDQGQLGRAASSTESFAAPTSPAITNAVSISTEARGSCVVRATGGITCWGRTPFSGGPDHVDVEAFEPLP